MSGDKNAFPSVRSQTTYELLAVKKKRRVTISIEHHISANTYFLVVALPKAGFDSVIINEAQAESLLTKFKIDLTNVR